MKAFKRIHRIAAVFVVLIFGFSDAASAQDSLHAATNDVLLVSEFPIHHKIDMNESAKATFTTTPQDSEINFLFLNTMYSGSIGLGSQPNTFSFPSYTPASQLQSIAYKTNMPGIPEIEINESFLRRTDPGIPAPAKTDSVVYGFLPALGYDSDNGFIGGGLVSRYHYDIHQKPFRNQFQIYGLLSTRGLFSVGLVYDQLNMFQRSIRTTTYFNAARMRDTPYFGIGNQTPFDINLWEEGTYFYESYFIELMVRSRYTLWSNASRKDNVFDLAVLNHIRWINPQSGNGGNLFETDTPYGSDGGWTWLPGIGANWENRDNEFAPTSGNVFEIDMRFSPGVASDYQMWMFNFLGSQYFTADILLPVTLALKLGYMQVGGDVPYFILADLGGEQTFRGYPPGRFRGDAALYYTAELRTWFFHMPEYGFRMGAQAFSDAGRVFWGDSVRSEFFRDHHRTFGVGGAVSLFTYDFILRGELGFSDEIRRFYFGIGYAF